MRRAIVVDARKSRASSAPKTTLSVYGGLLWGSRKRQNAC